MTESFFSDTPISERASDLFNRWPFAQRIAHTITSRPDKSSIVIGIYGTWGEGKTSVLRFIEQEIQKEERFVCINFNPWRFPEEDKLLQDFYSAIASGLRKLLPTGRERLGKFLQQYDAFFALIDHSEVSKSIVNILANTTPEEYKKRLEALLDASSTRVVILMDDIDRLNRTEIQRVFRLIKLSADFTNTAYILAFDEEVVSDAIGEQYGSSGKESGRKFLEKIITVPLRLPQAEVSALRDLCLKGIEQSLKQAEIKIERDDQALFLHLFDRLLYRKLRTPRLIKRYNNAVMFALPILKDEVYPIDVMFVEGLRVFYPKQYEYIKENPDLFVGAPATNADALARALRDRQPNPDIITTLCEGLLQREAELFVSVLKEIFPALDASMRGEGYRENRVLAENKRVGSQRFFQRYFSYSISKTDARVSEVVKILSAYEERLEDPAILLAGITTKENASNVLANIRLYTERLTPIQARNLALALSQNASLFESVDSLGVPASRFISISSMIYDLISLIDDPQVKLATAVTVASSGQPIYLAVEFQRWVSNPRYKPEARFAEAEQRTIGEIVATRVARLAEEKLVYDPTDEYATSLLYAWSYWTSKDTVTEYVLQTFDDNPSNITKLLALYLNFGLFAGADNVDDRYNELSLVLDTDAIYKYLLKVYGDDMKAPSRHAEIDDRDEGTFAVRLAHIFAYLYLKTDKNDDSQATPTHEA